MKTMNNKGWNPKATALLAGSIASLLGVCIKCAFDTHNRKKAHKEKMAEKKADLENYKERRQFDVDLQEKRDRMTSIGESSPIDATATTQPLRTSKVYGQHKTDGTDDKPEFLVEFIKRGGINFIGGPTGSCKSTLAVQILLCIALGIRSIFDLMTEIPSVFIGIKAFLYDAENGIERFEKRFCSNGYCPAVEVIHKRECRFSSLVEFLADIRQRVSLYGKDCVVCIDNITRLFSSMNDQMALQLYDGLEAIQNEMQACGCCITFIVVCHTNDEIPFYKGVFESSFRGTANLVSFSDYSIGVNHARGGKDHKYIKPLKERDSATDSVQKVILETAPIYHLVLEGTAMEQDAVMLRPKSVSSEDSGSSAHPAKEKRPTESDILTIKEMLSKKASVEEIANALNVSVSTYHNYRRKIDSSEKSE